MKSCGGRKLFPPAAADFILKSNFKGVRLAPRRSLIFKLPPQYASTNAFFQVVKLAFSDFSSK